MKIREDLNISEPPYYCGDIKDIRDAANCIIGTNHSVILNYILLFAYSGDQGGIRSVIITTSNRPGKLSISIIYDNYSMIYQSMDSQWLISFIESLTDKKLLVLRNGLLEKFIEPIKI